MQFGWCHPIEDLTVNTFTHNTLVALLIFVRITVNSLTFPICSSLYFLIVIHCLCARLLLCMVGVYLLCNSMHRAALCTILLDNAKRPIRAGLRERRGWTKGSSIPRGPIDWLSPSFKALLFPLIPCNAFAVDLLQQYTICIWCHSTACLFVAISCIFISMLGVCVLVVSSWQVLTWDLLPRPWLIN